MTDLADQEDVPWQIIGPLQRWVPENQFINGGTSEPEKNSVKKKNSY